MPKQSPTNPRFRCNGCKEFHTAPQDRSHYQCAVHGYLCSEYTFEEGYREGCCGVIVKVWEPNIIQWKKRIDYCEKKLIKYNWHKDIGRWIEKGKEKKEKAKAKKTAPKKTVSVADEIKKFKELLDAGAITQKEYDTKKKELLGL